MKKDKDWTDILGERLREYETDAPEGLWQDIEAALDRQASAMPRTDGTRTVSMRRTLLAVAACIAVIAVSGLLVYVGIDSQTADMDIANKALTMQPSVGKQSGETEENISAKETAKGHDELALAQTHVANHGVTEDKPVVSEEKTSGLGDENQRFTEAKPAVSEQETSDLGQEEQQQSSVKSDTYVRNSTQHPQLPRQKKNRKTKWNISAYTTNLPSTDLGDGGDMSDYGYDMMSSESTITYSAANNTAILQNNFTDAVKENTYINDKTSDRMSLDHKTPLNIGLKLRIGLTDRLFAETGVVYSYLKSEGTSSARSYTQRLHYVGIPLGIGYNIWRKGNVTVYAVGGGTAQKLVSGKADTQYYMRGIEERKTLKEGGMQWSVNAAAGIEYSIKSIVRLYAEPCVSYYFDNGSRIDNIYKDKPTALNLQFGLRFGM